MWGFASKVVTFATVVAVGVALAVVSLVLPDEVVDEAARGEGDPA
jgi:uncharacterized membrane protein